MPVVAYNYPSQIVIAKKKGIFDIYIFYYI